MIKLLHGYQIVDRVMFIMLKLIMNKLVIKNDEVLNILTLRYKYIEHSESSDSIFSAIKYDMVEYLQNYVINIEDKITLNKIQDIIIENDSIKCFEYFYLQIQDCLEKLLCAPKNDGSSDSDDLENSYDSYAVSDGWNFFDKYDVRNTLYKDICMKFIVNNAVKCLKFLYNRNLFEYSAKKFITSNTSESIEYLKNFLDDENYIDIDTNKDMIILAVSQNNLYSVKLFHEKGHIWHSQVCTRAAEDGNLDILIYAHENGCHWNKNTLTAAKKYGHEKCYQFALNNDCNNNRYGLSQFDIADHTLDKYSPNNPFSSFEDIAWGLL